MYLETACRNVVFEFRQTLRHVRNKPGKWSRGTRQFHAVMRTRTYNNPRHEFQSTGTKMVLRPLTSELLNQFTVAGLKVQSARGVASFDRPAVVGQWPINKSEHSSKASLITAASTYRVLSAQSHGLKTLLELPPEVLHHSLR